MNGVISQAGADRSVRLPFQLKQVPLVREGEVLLPGVSVCLPEGDAFGRTVSLILSEALNDLAAKGGKGTHLGVKALFPEDTTEAQIRHLFDETARFCALHHLSAVSPDAAYAPGLTAPVLCASAYGALFPEAEGVLPRSFFHIRAADPGTQVVMAGTAGWAGTGILALREKRKLLSRFPQSLVADAVSFMNNTLTVRAAEIGCAYHPSCMVSVGEGGIFRALWLLGQEMNAGFEMDLRAIPIRQETVEICEWLNVHPYQLYGSGALLIVTEQGDALCEALLEEGIEAAVLGRMKNTPARVLVNGEEARYLEKPQQDSLWTACGA